MLRIEGKYSKHLKNDSITTRQQKASSEIDDEVAKRGEGQGRGGIIPALINSFLIFLISLDQYLFFDDHQYEIVGEI